MGTGKTPTAQSKSEKRRLLFEKNLVTIYLLIKEKQPITISKLIELSTDGSYYRVKMNKIVSCLMERGMVKRLSGEYPYVYEAIHCDVKKEYIEPILMPVPAQALKDDSQPLTQVSDKDHSKNARITVIGNRTVHLCSNIEPHGDRGRGQASKISRYMESSIESMG